MAKKSTQKTERICWVAKTTNPNYTSTNGEAKWMIVGDMFSYRAQAESYLKSEFPNKPHRIVGGRMPFKVILDFSEKKTDPNKAKE